MGILDNYRKQLEEDKMNEDSSLPDMAEYSFGDNAVDFTQEEYEEKLNELRNDENDMEVQYRRFHQTYVKMSEDELREKGLAKDVEVKTVIRRAYCPNCGKELVSNAPVLFNPYTMEKICKYDCECGFKGNLEYAYPRTVYVDAEGNEIEAYGK